MQKLVFIIIFTAFSSTYAIDQDSLYSIWFDSNQEDTTRINANDKFVNLVFSGTVQISIDSAITLSDELEIFAVSKNNIKGTIIAYNNLILSYAFKGDIDKCEELATKSLNLCRTIDYETGKAITFYNLAIAYYMQNDFENSIENYEKSLHKFKIIGDYNRVSGTLINLGNVYYKMGDYINALAKYEATLEIEKEQKNEKLISQLNNNIGQIHSELGNITKSIDFLKKSIIAKERANDKKGLAFSYHNLGLVYERIDEFKNALLYFNKSLKLEEELKNQKGIAESLNSIGDIYFNKNQYNEAIERYEMSSKIFDTIKEENGYATTLKNIAKVYSKWGQNEKADELFKKSLDIHSKLWNKKELALTYNLMGKSYEQQNKNSKAIEYCKKGLEISSEIELASQLKSSCECLYIAYKALGNTGMALHYYEKMDEYNTDLKSQEVKKKLMQMEYEKQKITDSLAQEEDKLRTQLAHEEELSSENQKRNIAIGAGLLLLVLVGGLFSRVRYIRKSKNLIEAERDKSENLLLNILPSEIAKELKEKGRSEARDYKDVTILFTDFKEFTQASEKLTAKELIDEINNCFENFDSICDKYKIEKIKTIGDSYMVAGGLLLQSEDSAKNTVLAGLEMKDYILRRKDQRMKEGKIPFEMRIGIHHGDVIAGIVGTKKFQYDIWGDTVNTASRLESSGEVGKVNVSKTLHDLLIDNKTFEFEYRGKINAKGKGEVEMYFVERVNK